MDRAVLVAAVGGVLLAVSVWHVKHRVARQVVAEPAGNLSSTMTAGAPATSNSCRAAALRLRLPIEGSMGKDWLLANFFDREEASGQTRDYAGRVGREAITYDGHSGIDFELASFRSMDQGVAVLAAADGVVEETYALSFDRNQTCVDDKWNFVRIRHANGFATVYAHLRKQSVMVRPGARVSAGMRLGLVGSSGCSRYPHLHFEVLDCQNRAIDVMPENLFETPLTDPLRAPASVMETSVFQPVIRDILSIQNPETSDLHEVVAGAYFSLAATVANIHPGDQLRFDFITPDNSLAPYFFETRAEKFDTRAHWWSDFALTTAGPWLARISINGQVQAQRVIQVIEK